MNVSDYVLDFSNSVNARSKPWHGLTQIFLTIKGKIKDYRKYNNGTL